MAATAPAPKPQATDQQIIQKYGQAAWALAIPEIAPILRQAATEEWDAARLQGAIAGTNWWKTTSDTARQWQALLGSDPQSANQRLANKSQEIIQAAKKMGIEGVTDDVAKQMADQFFRYGWNDQMLQQSLAARWQFDPNNPQGVGGMGSVSAKLKQAADAYGVPMTDSAIAQWAKQIATGDSSQEVFTTELVKQAKGLYKGIADSISTEVSTVQLAQPYFQMAAQELGMDPARMTLRDTKWSKPLSVQDPKSGQMVAMNLDDWRRTIRKDSTYGYDYTDNAKQQAWALRDKLMKEFGYEA